MRYTKNVALCPRVTFPDITVQSNGLEGEDTVVK